MGLAYWPTGQLAIWPDGQWPVGQFALSDVDDRLRDRVRRGNHLGVGLEVSLRGDHVHELFGDVDVRRFERAGLNQAEPRVAGLAAQRLTRAEGLRPARVAELLQALRIREVRDRNLTERQRAAVREARLH